MKVLKFGGTSVGSVENINNVKNIINDGEQKIIVLSAMSGTTNALVEITNCIINDEPNIAIELINDLHGQYFETVDDLISNKVLNKQMLTDRDI